MLVGANCENRFQALWEKTRNEAWERRPGVSELRAAQDEFKAIPIGERAGFVTASRGRELSEEVEEAIRAIRKTPKWVSGTNRVFHLTAPRPKGVKAGICSTVAQEFFERYGVSLKPNFVQVCWDDYRRFGRETDEPD